MHCQSEVATLVGAKTAMGRKDGGTQKTSTMRTDFDLQFLEHCKNEDLKTLCDILTRDKNGKIIYSEQLTNTDSYYKCYPHKMSNMWQDLALELQKYGGNTFMNVIHPYINTFMNEFHFSRRELKFLKQFGCIGI